MDVDEVDVDALESLVDSRITDYAASLAVTFEYEGYLVHIGDNGTLTGHENVE